MATANLSKFGSVRARFLRGLRLSFILETALWITGAVCTSISALLFLDQHANAQRAVAEFIDAHEATGRLSEFSELVAVASSELDQDLWSPTRIATYGRQIDAARSDAIAVLRVPALELEAPVFEGALDAELDRGPGWIRGTAQINSNGNVAIAGHRDGFFRALKDIEAGEVIEVLGPESIERYRVTDTWIVDPDAVHVLDPTAEPALTLVTCYPFYFVGHAPQRFIVRAVAETI